MMSLNFLKGRGFTCLKTLSFIIGFLNLIGTLFVTVCNILYIGSVVLDKPHIDDALGAGVARMYVVFFSVLLIFLLIDIVLTIGFIIGLHKNKRDNVLFYVLYSGLFSFFVLIFIFLASSGGILITAVCTVVVVSALSVVWLTYCRMNDEAAQPICSDA